MKKKILVGALVALFFMPLNVFAAKGDQGVDWAIYQGEQGRFGYAHDKFAMPRLVATMLAVFMNNTHIKRK